MSKYSDDIRTKILSNIKIVYYRKLYILPEFYLKKDEYNFKNWDRSTNIDCNKKRAAP